jgi:hypothetical protein
MIELEVDETGSACIPNIGPKERWKRMLSGITTLIIAVLFGMFLIFNAWAWWTRFILFLPLFSGFVGIFQAREKT